MPSTNARPYLHPSPRALGTLLVTVLLFVWVGGCARYEYDVVEPQDLAQHVGKQPVAFPIEPLEYRLQSAQNRLVMFVYNPTEDPIKLLGEDSVAVDPQGESHPLEGRTIAPGSRIKLILPPMPPQLRRTGPSIGIGVGAVYGSAYPYRRRSAFGYSSTVYDDYPRYYALVDDGTIYWDWRGESDVRLTLRYERMGEAAEGEDRRGRRFAHEFVFHRRKM